MKLPGSEPKHVLLMSAHVLQNYRSYFQYILVVSS